MRSSGPFAMLSDGPMFYFVFLEERTPAVGSDGVDSPIGIPMRSPRLGKGGSIGRLRFSAISRQDFERVADRVDPLPDVGLSLPQRRSRRAQLTEALNSVPLPLLDVFMTTEELESPAVTVALDRSLWFGILLERASRRSDWDGVMVNPEAQPPTLQYVQVLQTFRVRRATARRLQDIFSLKHIADMGDGDEPEGEPTPTPPITPLLELERCVIRVPPDDDHEPTHQFETAVERTPERLMQRLT